MSTTPTDTGIPGHWTIIAWTIWKMMRKLPWFRCNLKEQFKKKNNKPGFISNFTTLKKLKKFIIQTQLSLASVLFRLCKECRKEPVNIFLNGKKDISDLTLLFSQPSGERESSQTLFHEVSITSLIFVSLLSPIQTHKNQPQLNHLTTPREQYLRNHTISYFFSPSRDHSPLKGGWSEHTNE